MFRGSPYSAVFSVLIFFSFILAFFCYSTNADVSIYSFLQGLSEIKLSSIQEFNTTLTEFVDALNRFSQNAPGFNEGFDILSFFSWVKDLWFAIRDLLFGLISFLVDLLADVLHLLTFLTNFLFSIQIK